MIRQFAFILGNSFAVVLLLALFATPFYFARNFSQVAGVKSESAYLVVPQVSKFPGITFNQSGENYTVQISKQADSQAYLSVLILNNPLNVAKTYSIVTTSPGNTVFFGEDLTSQDTTLQVPPQTSVPLSLVSLAHAGESVNFQIVAK